MRILHVTDSFLPVLGGIEVLVDDLSANQRRFGHDVRILTAIGGPSGSPPDDVLRLRHAFARIDEVIAGFAPDVVHAHSSVLSPLAWRAARRATVLGTPAVITMHSLLPGPGLESAAVWLGASTIPPEVTWTAVSQAAAHALARVVHRPVRVIPNGIDLSAAALASPGRSAVPSVISVMRLARRKRPLALISILASVRRLLGDQPWQATLVGDGPQTAAVKRAIRAAGLGDRVQLTGRLSREGVRSLLATSDLYLAPARLESFGLAALEARCAGVPIVALRSGGVGEFVADGRHGYLTASDHEMALRTAQLLSDPAALQQLSHDSLAEPPDLGWPVTVERTLTAYAQAGAPSRALHRGDHAHRPRIRRA